MQGLDQADASFCPNSEPFFPQKGSDAAKEDVFKDPIEFSNLYTYQISRMKAQHQYITNLQRANIALKNKIKQLKEIAAQDSQVEPHNADGQAKTFDDLEPEESQI